THSFLDGFLFVERPANFLIILVLSFFVWFLYIVMMYFAFYAFGLQELGWRAALVVQAISSIGFAMPTPGATGSYHYFATETLHRLYHVPQEIALSYATVTHAVAFVGVTVVGVYFFLQDHIKVSEAVKKEAEGPQ
ncbi:MAG: flippase-like domain-containing protein, partial [Ignavibacteriae bacterium]|nr:flippase-like domain-containing protein [Ignavibacteriota bacterium]